MNTETIFRVVFGVVLISMVLIRGYYQRRFLAVREKVSFRESRLNMAVRLVLGLAGVVGLFVYLLAPQWMAWSTLPLPDGLRWLGAALGLAAIPLLYWVHATLGQNFASTLHLREGHTLITSGPYRWVRHPMYTVFYLMVIAFFLLSTNWFIGAFYLAGLTGVIVSRVPKEEAVMVEKFGDEYRAYMRHTGRFLPRRLGSST